MRESGKVKNQREKDPRGEVTTIDDVEDVLRLYPEASEAQRREISLNVRDDIEDAKRGNRIIYGFRRDGKIVGTTQLIFKDPKPYYADGKTRAHLYHTRVAEELRSRGIGQMLIAAIEDEARKRGFTEITLGVDVPNEDGRRLYERLGYREFTREMDYSGKRGIIGMKKSLKEA